MTINDDTFIEAITRAAEYGAKRAIEEAGLTKITISLAEIKKLYTPLIAMKARTSLDIQWEMHGEGRRASETYCLKSQFDKWLFKREFSFYKR